MASPSSPLPRHLILYRRSLPSETGGSPTDKKSPQSGKPYGGIWQVFKPVCRDFSEINHCLLFISFGKIRFKRCPVPLHCLRSAFHDHRPRWARPERLESGGPSLLTVETDLNVDSKSSNERGPSLVGSLGLSCRYKRFLFCLRCSSRPRVACLLVCVSGQDSRDLVSCSITIWYLYIEIVYESVLCVFTVLLIKHCCTIQCR
jgi:hypothetical protein